MKFSALNVDFNRASFVPLGTGVLRTSARNFGTPFKTRVFCYCMSTNLARERLQIDTDLLRIMTSTADELSVGTNIDDLERP